MIITFWNWFWHKSIRRQLIAAVALVYLALMTVFVGYLVVAQRRFLQGKARTHALARTELLAMSCVHGLQTNDLAGLQEIVQSMRTDHALRYAMIMDLKGRILAHTDPSQVGQTLQDATSRKLLEHEGQLDCAKCHATDDSRRNPIRGATCAAVLVETDQTLDIVAPILVQGRPLGWARLARDLSDDNAHLRTLTVTGIGFTLFAILIGTGVAAGVGTAVLRPLHLLLQATQRVSQNQLHERIPITTENEVGVVSTAFNNAMDQLQNQITEREQAEARLREQAREVMESAQVLTAASADILESARRLAQSAHDAATAVAQTTSTVEEVRQTARGATQQAEYVAACAHKADQSAQSGRKFTEATAAGMARIRQQMDSIASGMVHLSEQTRAIGQIITSVDDLAAQSNLLAVNAAIEAAKAGEHGKGFVVVAQEVKNLAEQSKQFTRQVRTILSDIQKATEAATSATSQGTKVVEAGVQQSAQVGDSIQSLAGSVTEAAQSATQITTSSQQQLSGMDQVASAMDRITQVAALNVTSAQQLEAAAGNLNELGQKLEQLVQTYET